MKHFQTSAPIRWETTLSKKELQNLVRNAENKIPDYLTVMHKENVYLCAIFREYGLYMGVRLIGRVLYYETVNMNEQPSAVAAIEHATKSPSKQ